MEHYRNLFSLSLPVNNLISLKCTICLEEQIAVEAKAPINLLTFVWRIKDSALIGNVSFTTVSKISVNEYIQC
jgi:hypothetical protein